MENVNLVGDKIPPKQKNVKGKPRTVFFSKVVAPNHEKLNILNEWETHTFKAALNETFENFVLGSPEICEIEGERYSFTLFQKDDRYFLFSISHTKKFGDILAEPIDSNTEKTIEKKNMMLRYYTFILADIQSNFIAFLFNRNLPNINAILNIFFIERSKIALFIEPLKNPKIEHTIKNALKSKTMTFTLNTALQSSVSVALDDACKISRESETYKVTVSVKSPGKKFINSILENTQKILAFQKARIQVIDENGNTQNIDLFSNQFSYKINISIDDIDLKENQRIKEKLILAISSLKDVI